jgi:hypothetical protein
MGYPDWFWDWSNWYLTTDRDPAKRPGGTPNTIPDWAWEGQAEIEKVGNTASAFEFLIKSVFSTGDMEVAPEMFFQFVNKANGFFKVFF